MEHKPVGKGYVGLVSDEPDREYATITFECECGDPDCTWVGSGYLSRYNPKA